MLKLLFSQAPKQETDYRNIGPENDQPRPYPGTKIPGYPSCCTLSRFAKCCCLTGTAIAAGGATAIALLYQSELPSNVKIGVYVAGGIALLASCYCVKNALAAKFADSQFEMMHQMAPELMTDLEQFRANFTTPLRPQV